MLDIVADVVIGTLAGPLVVAGAAKLSTDANSLSWPFDRGALAVPHGPKLVGVIELGVAAAMVTLPGGVGAGLGITAYASLAAAATALRGRRCACFGRARLAAVNRTHVVGNVLAGAAAAAALVVGPGTEPILRAAAATVAAVAAVGLLHVLDRRRGPHRENETTACTDRVSGVRLYTSAGCPSCRSLKTLIDAMEPARRDLVTTTELGPGETAPAPLTADMGVPAAYAVNAVGEQVCAPVSGIGAVKALIDSITVGPRSSVGVPDGR